MPPGGSPATISPDGSIKAFALANGTVRLIDAGSGRELATLYEPLGAAFLMKSALTWTPRVAFSADRKWLATTRGSDAVHLWNAADFSKFRPLEDIGVVSEVSFAPSSRLLIALAFETKSSGRPNVLAVWETETGKRKILSRQVDFDFESARFSADERSVTGVLVASEGGARRALEWDIKTGELVESR